jgi:hypothetical protein
MTMPDFEAIFGVKKRRPRWRPPIHKDDDGRAHLDAEMDSDAPTSNEPLADGGPSATAAKHVSDIADLIVTAGNGEITKPDALSFLLYHQRGRTMAHRLASRHKRSPQQKEQQQMKSTSMDDIRKQAALLDDIMRSQIVKQGHLMAFAKSVTDGEVICSESQLTKMICEHAERNGTTFAKLFSAQDADGVTLRKAITAARDANWSKAAQGLMPTKPRVSDETASSGMSSDSEAYRNLLELAQAMHDASPERSVAQHFSAIVQDKGARDKARREILQAHARVPLNLTPSLAKTAYDELVSKAEELRKADPSLTEAKAFSKVYTDPRNAALAAQERQDNRPRA